MQRLIEDYKEKNKYGTTFLPFVIFFTSQTINNCKSKTTTATTKTKPETGTFIMTYVLPTGKIKTSRVHIFLIFYNLDQGFEGTRVNTLDLLQA